MSIARAISGWPSSSRSRGAVCCSVPSETGRPVRALVRDARDRDKSWTPCRKGRLRAALPSVTARPDGLMPGGGIAVCPSRESRGSRFRRPASMPSCKLSEQQGWGLARHLVRPLPG